MIYQLIPNFGEYSYCWIVKKKIYIEHCTYHSKKKRFFM